MGSVENQDNRSRITQSRPQQAAVPSREQQSLVTIFAPRTGSKETSEAAGLSLFTDEIGSNLSSGSTVQTQIPESSQNSQQSGQQPLMDIFIGRSASQSNITGTTGSQTGSVQTPRIGFGQLPSSESQNLPCPFKKPKQPITEEEFKEEFDQASDYAHKEMHDKAIEKCQRLLERGLTREQTQKVLQGLGGSYLNSGRYSEASKAFEQLLGDNTLPQKDRSHALVGLGLSYSEEGKSNDAIKVFKQALSDKDLSDIDRQSAKCTLGQAYSRIHDFPNAIKAFKDALSEKNLPGRNYWKKELGSAYRENHQYQEAINTFNDVLSDKELTDAQRKTVINELGKSYNGAGQYSKAIELCQKNLSGDPKDYDSIEMLDTLSNAYIGNGDVEKGLNTRLEYYKRNSNFSRGQNDQVGQEMFDAKAKMLEGDIKNWKEGKININGGEIGDFCQGETGDCFLLGLLPALKNNPQMRELIKNSIIPQVGEDGKETGNYIVRLAGAPIDPATGKPKERLVTKEEFFDPKNINLSIGSDVVKLLEIAARDFLPKTKNQADGLDGGIERDSFKLLTGKDYNIIPTFKGTFAMVDATSILDKASTNPDRFILGASFNIGNPDKDISTKHSYAITHVDKDFVELSDPRDSMLRIRLSRKEFMAYMPSLMFYDMMDNSK